MSGALGDISGCLSHQIRRASWWRRCMNCIWRDDWPGDEAGKGRGGKEKERKGEGREGKGRKEKGREGRWAAALDPSIDSLRRGRWLSSAYGQSTCRSDPDDPSPWQRGSSGSWRMAASPPALPATFHTPPLFVKRLPGSHSSHCSLEPQCSQLPWGQAPPTASSRAAMSLEVWGGEGTGAGRTTFPNAVI